MPRNLLMRFCTFVLVLLLSGVAAGIAPQVAWASGTVGDGTPTSCTDAAFSAALAGGGQVYFACGPDAITIHVSTKIIDRNTSINGGGLVTLSGSGANRLFDVRNAARLRLRDVTLADARLSAVVVAASSILEMTNTTLTNSSGEPAGAISSEGHVTITDSVLSLNSSTSGAGAIASYGTRSVLTIVRSQIIDNTGNGAGAIIVTGALSISDSTISGNQAISGDGGGVRIASYESTRITRTTFANNTTTGAGRGGGLAAGPRRGALHIESSTFRGNHAHQGGGLALILANARVVNTTIAENSAQSGGGVFARRGTFRNSSIVGNRATEATGGMVTDSETDLANTIVAGNSAPVARDCGGPVHSSGYNLIGTAAGCYIMGDLTGNVLDVDATMSTLSNYGGPTETSRPLPGSPAIDAGNPAAIGSGDSACEATDQRGVARPIGDRCDIGAFEAESRIGPTTEATTDETPSQSGWFRGAVTVRLHAFGSDGIESITYAAVGTRDIVQTTVPGSSAIVLIPRTAQGTTTLSYFATDTNGTVEAQHSLDIRIDGVRPAITSLTDRIVEGAQIKGSSKIVATLDWSGSDNRSGIARYELQIRLHSQRRYFAVALPTAMTTTMNYAFKVDEGYSFRVRAIDEAGMVGTWVNGNFSTSAIQESDSPISYTHGWPASYVSGAFGGTVRFASSPAASAAMTFDYQTRVAWISTRGPNRGLAEVWLNGVKVRTIDLYAPTQQPARAVFVADIVSALDNTIEIRPTGMKNDSSSGYRVDMDAFITGS